MTSSRLISADSHVAVSLDAIRERVPAALHEAFDDAIAEQARIDAELKQGGSSRSTTSTWRRCATRAITIRWRASRPWTATASRPRCCIRRSSAFRSFGLVKGDWRPISRAFTDHLSDFAAHDPDRLAVSYQVPIIDIQYAVSEVERLAALGARSVHLPNFPSELGLPDYHEQLYDPLWGALQETGISISHHLGNRNSLWDVFRRDPTPQSAIFTSLPAMALAEVVAWWILTGTLERFPGLQIVFVEPQPPLDPGLPRPARPQGRRVRTTSPGCA